MTRYLLDTNVISELRKAKPHGGVIAWDGATQRQLVYISAVSIGEIQAGIERTRRKDKQKAAELQLWCDMLSTGTEILSMDGPCFREWAKIMEGKSDDLMLDAMIAATARVHSLTVVTRNERDFRHFGVKVLNPFTYK